MRKLLRRIVESVTTMSTRPHNYGDDASRRYRSAVPVPATRASRETVGSASKTAPEPLSSARGTTYPTSHVRNESAAPSRSLSVPQVPHDVQERVDMELNCGEHRKTSGTFTNDQRSTYAKEEEVAKIRDELQFRPPKEDDQYRYERDRTDDRRDTPRGTHYPSLKEIFNIYHPPPAQAKVAEPTTPASTNLQHLYEAQLTELSALRQKHQAVLEEHNAQANSYVSLKQQYDEQSKKLSAMRHERQASRVQRKRMEDAYADLKQQYEEHTKELSAIRHGRQAALEQLRKAEEGYTALRQKYEALSNGYNALSNKHHSSKATLEQRTSELHGIQKFLTTADTFSGSEVVSMLRKLNEEVQQSTTFMAEWAVENFMAGTPLTGQTVGQSIEQTRTSEALGMTLMQLLGIKRHGGNPILIEVAFRAYLIYELYWIASPWSIGEEEQSHNLYIDAIYQRMRDAEGQAVSGNWRALTRAYALPTCITDPELAHNFDTTIISGFSDILLAAGCTTSKDDITSGLWSKFAEKIHYFVSLAGQVNKMIGVGVISEDFEVQVVSPGVVFDGKVMEDSYDNGERVQGAEEHKETVLCAAELGLVQRMKVGAGRGKQSELTVIKPKVVLISVIDIIDE